MSRVEVDDDPLVPPGKLRGPENASPRRHPSAASCLPRKTTRATAGTPSPARMNNMPRHTAKTYSAAQPSERHSVDRLAVQPLNDVVGRERPHPRGVPGEVGVVEEVAPLAARPAAEECWRPARLARLRPSASARSPPISSRRVGADRWAAFGQCPSRSALSLAVGRVLAQCYARRAEG